MSGEGATRGIFVLLSLLVVGLASIARRTQTPYPIVLVVAGLVSSLIPGMPALALEPDLVFYVVLPPLLYAAAWMISWRELQRNMVSVISVASGLVVFTIVGMAALAHLLFPQMGWRLALLFGAVVAPTDATAATAIATKLRLPAQIVELLEGESLVNDATGLLAIELGLALTLQGVMPSATWAAARFVYLAAAGVGIGWLVAVVVDWLERRIDDGPIEIALSLLVPYVAYVAADGVKASGVLAVVTSGLILSRRSATFFSPAVRLQIYAVWGSVVFILNAMVFGLIGLQLPSVVRSIGVADLPWLVFSGALCGAAVVVLRLLWVWPGATLSFLIRRRFLGQDVRRLPVGQLVIFGWGGMRGVVSLAAAFSLPLVGPSGTPVAHRSLLVFLAFSVVIWTLVVHGLTLAPLATALGLTESDDETCEALQAHQIVLTAALRHVEQLQRTGDAEFRAVYDDVAQHYRERLEAIDRGDDTPRQFQRSRELSTELLLIQRRTLLALSEQGRIDDRVRRDVERDLDLQEARGTE
jgi:CPA1 family monovalent cation:H+ antiporter